MKLDHSTFLYLKPTDHQHTAMNIVRNEAANFAKILEDNVPDGPDKTYMLRKFREVIVWANIGITREANGSPRVDELSKDN